MTQPTSVARPIRTASVAIAISGGRPPATRQAIPTSIAPTVEVTAGTGSPAAISPPSSANTGIPASSPAAGAIPARSKRAAARTAVVSGELGSGAVGAIAATVPGLPRGNDLALACAGR